MSYAQLRRASFALRFALKACCLLLFFATALRAQDADSPILILDTGGHNAVIGGLAFTSDGKFLLSGSDDKSLRVWDWQEGRTVRTIRGDIGPGDQGKTYALAVSPDGATVAVGGYFCRNYKWEGCRDIRLFEIATGKLKDVLPGDGSLIFSLAFSGDGTRIIAGGSAKFASIWEISSKEEIRLVGHSTYIWGVGFSADGKRAITGSYDKSVKIWRSADGKEIANLTGHNEKVTSTTVSKQGLIASGDYGGEVKIWDEGSGKLLQTLAGHSGKISSLAFSPDGAKLLVGEAKITNRKPPYDVSSWDVAAGKKEFVFREHDGDVGAIAITPDGRFAASAGGARMAIHIWDRATGQRIRKAGDNPLSLQGTGTSTYAVAFSTDDRDIAWGRVDLADEPNNRGPVELVLKLPDQEKRLTRPRPLVESELPPSKLQGAITKTGTSALVHRTGGESNLPEAILDLLRNQVVVRSNVRRGATGYRHLAYTFAGEDLIISGGRNGVLTAFDSELGSPRAFVGHDGDVVALAASSDSKLLLSGGEDQTVRLWSIESGELIVSLFSGTNSEWIMWTPEGYYASSANGDSLVGWQLNRGYDKAAEYFTARQLKIHFYRPDIIERAIMLRSASAAVEEARKRDPDRMRFELNTLIKRTPPVFSVLSPADQSGVAGGTANIIVGVDETHDPANRMEIFVNDAQVTDPKLHSPDAILSGTRNLEVPLVRGENRIRIRISNAVGATEAPPLKLFASSADARSLRETLFVYAIGVDKYTKLVGKDLKFATGDAIAFQEQIISAAGHLHKNTRAKLLVSGSKNEPTFKNILDAFDELRAARENDTVVIFLAGHGVNDTLEARWRYLFLPADAEKAIDHWKSSTVISWSQLQESISLTGGRRFLFLDTCHSENSYNAEPVNKASYARVAVLSASDKDGKAWAPPHLKHGIFTYALLQGLSSYANWPQGEVRLWDFMAFVDREMRKVSEGKQAPSGAFQHMENAIIAQVLAKSKP